MKKKKLEKLREMSNEELQKELDKINLELMKARGERLRFKDDYTKERKFGLYQNLRKDKARILTLLNERRVE